ncbi:DUF6703 family protein [Nocardiopsis changdeensis]|uniref:Uncharacterized protein n=1 Tax=Nocardiopsis changdeensis TaxID=2831969 RepID=A0ABX8BIZ7_9ACTN|nr:MULTISPECIES: DUF6703 family protein [Nocardiopsis]QUX21393.1 hypothetical protein KGD84_23670 [Nocardiopsis changdeensis]QYX37325.1 hypothetical protein K1J57_01040 [Nocardiopsis sp. MT53]
MAPPEHGDDKRTDEGGAPLPSGDSLYTPGAGPVRRAVERRSAVPLVWLHRAPRWLSPVLLGALFVAGLLAPGLAGGLCLLPVALFLAWLAYLTWPSLDSRQRAPRVLIVVVIAVLAVARFLGF